MNADNSALEAESLRLADRALDALRAGRITDFLILLEALHDVKPEDDEPLPF
jgi:hypothetical protein